MRLKLIKFYEDAGIEKSDRAYAKRWLETEVKIWREMDSRQDQIWEASCPYTRPHRKLIDLRGYTK